MDNIETNLLNGYRERFKSEPAFVARAPGRVNLLGEHVDYNNGLVIPTAIDLTVWLAFSPSGTDQTTLVALDMNDEVTFGLENLPTKTRADGSPLPDWAKFPAGVMATILEAGHPAPGMIGVFTSDIPRGAGLSSSAAVEMAFAVAWEKLGNWDIPPMELAHISQRAENEYVGVKCGIMDQFASACGEVDRLLFLDCQSLAWETAPLPPDVAIVIADTSVRRSLANTNAYNDRRAACEEAVRLLKEKLPEINSLRDISLEDFNRLVVDLPEEVAKRATHVVNEIDRAKRGLKLLQEGELAAFGKLMNECHDSLRDLYDVSCSELDVMAAIGQALPGSYGARLTGAGFGGCTVNLVQRDEAAAFADALALSYEQQTGRHPEVHICRATLGAQVMP